MLKLLNLLLLLVAVIADDSDNQHVAPTKFRIVGGREVDIGDYSYQAQLLEHGRRICGASIISECWLLTATHCIKGSSPDRSIITGSRVTAKGGQHHEIEKAITHPEYNKTSNDNDVALIKLKKCMEFNENQQPIELATTVPRAGQMVTVSGFGKKGDDAEYADFLEAVEIPVVDFDTCAKRYVADPITKNMFCAGTGKTDACQGDSGGPAVIDNQLVGVVSSGKKCGDTVYPGIYATVANYLQWIDETIDNESIEPPQTNHNQSPKQNQPKSFLQLGTALFLTPVKKILQTTHNIENKFLTALGV